MAKKEKMKTPDWILEGYDSEEDYNKSKGLVHCSVYTKEVRVPLRGPKLRNAGAKKTSNKTFKLRKCPKCDSDDVTVVVGEETKGKWQCNKCGWKGTDVKKQELNEEEFMKYLDEKGEEIS